MVTTMTMKRHEWATKEVSVDRLSAVTEDDLVVASPKKALTNRVDCRGRCSRRDFTLLLFRRVEQFDFFLPPLHLSIVEQQHRHVLPLSITFYYQPTTMGCAYRRNKPKGVKRPNPKDKLPWGYDTPLSGNTLLKDTVPIDDFVKILTDPASTPPFQEPSKMS
jgi:hypothetical protein